MGWVVQFQLPMGVGHPIFKRKRHTFICQPKDEIAVETESSIQAFSAKYAVDQGLVVKYMHHLAYLLNDDGAKERKRKKGESSKREYYLTYENVEWGKLLYEDLVRKQRVSVLNLYIESYKLTTEKKENKTKQQQQQQEKKNKLDLVPAHIQL